MSASSMKSFGSTAFAIRSSIGSPPIVVITILLPAANGPINSICSMSSFQSGHLATSAHSRQTCSGVAVVSMLCSFAHIVTSLNAQVSVKRSGLVEPT